MQAIFARRSVQSAKTLIREVIKQNYDPVCLPPGYKKNSWPDRTALLVARDEEVDIAKEEKEIANMWLRLEMSKSRRLPLGRYP